jgi:succinate dehydrogenase / fumarate reductase cytochrome b subunit
MAASEAMGGLVRLFLGTMVGRKTLMALSGLAALAYIVLHLAGNSVVFDGANLFNGYADSLHAIPFLPLIELALAAVFVTHITLGIIITLQNAAVRPIPYAMRKPAGAETFASRTMIYTGLTVLAFMAFHVWTVRFAPASGTPTFERVRMVLVDPWKASVYLVGLVALAFHLSHGASGALLTLGARHPKHDPWVDMLGTIVAVVLAAGFIAIVVTFLAWGGPNGIS